MPRHAFRAANRIRHFFSASRKMRRWPHGLLEVTRRNSRDSLALRLARLYGKAPAVGSPLPQLAILSDCRFLIRVGSFHPTSSCRALLGAPFHPPYCHSSLAQQAFCKDRVTCRIRISERTSDGRCRGHGEFRTFRSEPCGGRGRRIAGRGSSAVRRGCSRLRRFHRGRRRSCAWRRSG